MMSEMLMRFNDQVRGGMKCHYSRRTKRFHLAKMTFKGLRLMPNAAAASEKRGSDESSNIAAIL